MNYLSVPNVEIAAVGMKWPASTGLVTLTMQHLADAQRAAMDDPHILIPRLKIGHVDPRFNEDPPVWDPFVYHGPLKEDGNPVYGRVANLRLENDGGVLVGDYIDVPEWLHQALPSAYPSRSQEADWDIETMGGKRYSMVVTAVSLLGERLPAIGSLEDLVTMLTRGPAALATEGFWAQQTPIHASRRTLMPTAAAASVDAVTRSFWTDFAVDERYWWWPVDVWVDPNQIIADDDEGHLYRVPFSTDTDGNVTFDDPVRVQQEFRDLPAVAAGMHGQLVARFAAASSARPSGRTRASAQPTEEEHMPVAPTAVLERLGLPEDATEEQMLAALDAEHPTDDDPENPDPETPNPEAEPAAQQPQPSAASNVVPVSKQVWDQTTARLHQLEQSQAARDAKETTDRRDSTAAAAVASGRITPAERSHYRGLLDIDEERTTELLMSLAPGRIPVGDPIGGAPSDNEDEVAVHASIMQHAYGLTTVGKGN